jgi:hypothetical protein
MSPDQTALVLFHREVLLPEITHAVNAAVAPLYDRVTLIEKRLKKIDQRINAWSSFTSRTSEQVEIVDLKIEELESLREVTESIADAVGAKLPWKKLSAAAEES